MNIHKAREIIENWERNSGNLHSMVDYVSDGDYFHAKGFLEGVASRDALIKELVQALEKIPELIDIFCDETASRTAKYALDKYNQTIEAEKRK